MSESASLTHHAPVASYEEMYDFIISHSIPAFCGRPEILFPSFSTDSGDYMFRGANVDHNQPLLRQIAFYLHKHTSYCIRAQAWHHTHQFGLSQDEALELPVENLLRHMNRIMALPDEKLLQIVQFEVATDPENRRLTATTVSGWCAFAKELFECFGLFSCTSIRW